MASWLLPALKAVLPHVGSIVEMAKPVFTRREAAPDQATLQQQVLELQAAAAQNAENVRELAQQLQTTVAALEQASVVAEARLRRAVWLGAAAIGLALLSLLLAGVALYTR